MGYESCSGSDLAFTGAGYAAFNALILELWQKQADFDKQVARRSVRPERTDFEAAVWYQVVGSLNMKKCTTDSEVRQELETMYWDSTCDTDDLTCFLFIGFQDFAKHYRAGDLLQGCHNRGWIDWEASDDTITFVGEDSEQWGYRLSKDGRVPELADLELPAPLTSASPSLPPQPPPTASVSTGRNDAEKHEEEAETETEGVHAGEDAGGAKNAKEQLLVHVQPLDGGTFTVLLASGKHATSLDVKKAVEKAKGHSVIAQTLYSSAAEKEMGDAEQLVGYGIGRVVIGAGGAGGGGTEEGAGAAAAAAEAAAAGAAGAAGAGAVAAAGEAGVESKSLAPFVLLVVDVKRELMYVSYEKDFAAVNNEEPEDYEEDDEEHEERGKCEECNYRVVGVHTDLVDARVCAICWWENETHEHVETGEQIYDQSCD
jgi:hypothetical protein